MKLKYVYTSAGLHESSVQKKVKNQIKALNELDVDCKGLFFTTEDIESESQEQYAFIKVDKIDSGWFRSFRQKAVYQKAILNYFKTKNIDTDYVYIRYLGPSKHLVKLAQLMENKVFFEHITHEMAEIKMYAQEQPFKWNLSHILSRIEFMYIPLFFESYFGRFVRRQAVFGVCNSNEIAEYENFRAGRPYIKMILGDAVDTASFSIRKPPVFDKELRMVFLKGASTQADFNGLDRVFQGIKNYNGRTRLKFYIYGKNLESEAIQIKKLRIESQVELKSFVEPKVLDEIVDNIHLGISALAVHRKGIKGTTTIKTREYCARGLPFVFGHNDPDFSDNEAAKKFSMELIGDDSAIDFQSVIDWYSSLQENINELPKEMNLFAENNLDYKVKMRRLRDLIQDL